MRGSPANNLTLREALDRTLRLMRDEVSDDVTDDQLLSALTETSVAIVADHANLNWHSAQSAFATLAMLLARSGHRVYLVAPNLKLLGNQPPLSAGNLIDQLDAVGRDILPGLSFVADRPQKHVDLAILLGSSTWSGLASRVVRLNATSWQARMTPMNVGGSWAANDWPIGAMGAAALAAADAFKIAMRRLRNGARRADWFDEHMAPTTAAYIDLAPHGTCEISCLNQVDFISGGAITNCALFTLLRLPNLSGAARVIEHDTVGLSNLNRTMLFLRSMLGEAKAEELSRYSSANFPIFAIPSRFELQTYAKLGRLTDAVLVGVDDIAVRWEVQKTWPRWLGVGATTHFSAMATFHTPELACAGCLHPEDDRDDAPIPTVAFVSFWSGLMLATLYLRQLAGNRRMDLEQQIHFWPMRPENSWGSPVPRHINCPVNCSSRIRSAV